MSITSSKKPNTSHFLGVDFGSSKIGFAIADSQVRIAFGYGILRNNRDIFEKIKKIVEKEGINKIIIGNPTLSLRGAERRSNLGQCKKTRDCSATLAMTDYIKFAEKLKSKLKIPVEFHSEMFSTREAERNLKEKGAKRIKRFDDREAARIILQSWLDKKR